MRDSARQKYHHIAIELAAAKDYCIIIARSLEIPSKGLRNYFLGFGVSLATAKRSRQNRGSMSSAHYF